MVIGNLCLVAGLLLWNFAHPTSQIEKNVMHAVTGLLMGISIAINLFALRFARRCNMDQPLT
jgi:hypothetical protein